MRGHLQNELPAEVEVHSLPDLASIQQAVFGIPLRWRRCGGVPKVVHAG
jgi:hypothetical protein